MLGPAFKASGPVGAGGGIRTHTSLRSETCQVCASTNSATPATTSSIRRPWYCDAGPTSLHRNRECKMGGRWSDAGIVLLRAGISLWRGDRNSSRLASRRSLRELHHSGTATIEEPGALAAFTSAPYLGPMSDLIGRLRDALADRYSIEKEIGAGGMATVYLAEDVRHHRKVAVKVLRSELADVGAGAVPPRDRELPRSSLIHTSCARGHRTGFHLELSDRILPDGDLERLRYATRGPMAAEDPGDRGGGHLVSTLKCNNERHRA